MHRPPAAGLATGFLLLISFASPTDAQVRASERGGVSQRIDGTDIVVDYARPQARGRDNIFGEVIHWGEVWTPGANWATTLEFSKDATLDGHDIAAGKYSVWLVPEEEGEWTLRLSPKADRFHTQRPPEDEYVLSLPVTPQEGEHMEVLTFHFPEVRRDGTTLHMHWGDTYLSVDVGVHATEMAEAFTSDEIAPYLGDYELTMFGEGEQTWEFDVELIDASGKLRGLVDDGEWAFELVRSSEPNTFYIGFMQDGEVVDVEEGPVHFDFDGEMTSGFTVLGIGIQVWMEATRKQ
jgi:hypothetical protein